MNLSVKGISTNKDSKLSMSNKITALNPNAAEFVPRALRSSSADMKNADVTRLDVTGTSGKAVLGRSESSVSNNSDDEVHQYWRHQLPDDITPDFKFTGEDELQGPGSLSVAGLSIHDGLENPRFSASTSGGQLMSKRLEIPSHLEDDISSSEKMRHSFSMYLEDQSVPYLNLPASPWNKSFLNGDQQLSNGKEGNQYSGDPNAGFLGELLSENAVLDDTEINPVEFLVSQFPGFAAESLADVYYANGCDLNLTIEMLTQLELQVDGGFNQNLNSKALSAPNLSSLDFPALPVPDLQNGLSKYSGDDLQQTGNPYQSVDKDNFLLFKSSSAGAFRGTTDFASAVRKIAPQDSQWKYERNGSTDIHGGTSRSSQLLASSYGGYGKSVYGDKAQSYSASRVAPVWLETGEAVGNMYSELREEARDHARVRNAYFEQARQAYLIGNKALAKELSVKGQLRNFQMKAAHGKARDSIYRQRNSAGQELSYGRGHERIIDLHGLHASEAIHMLKHELSILRSTARSAAQRLQVLICVGTGHHTKGLRTTARLPVAIKRYLLEEEGLECTEPQPGMLRVVIY